LTETCTVVCSSSPFDIVFGSSGCLLPGYEAKVMSVEGNEITGYDQPGELLVKSPSVVLGYLKNEKATKETFVDMPEGRFMRTGDEVVFRKSGKGNEHIWVVDRIKELIKVKVRSTSPRSYDGPILTATANRACKSRPPSWKRACSTTLRWPTAPSSPLRTTAPARCQKPSSSSHRKSVSRSPRRHCGRTSRSSSRRRRHATSGLLEAWNLSMSFPRALAGRS
jgi:hypothetical protein